MNNGYTPTTPINERLENLAAIIRKTPHGQAAINHLLNEAGNDIHEAERLLTAEAKKAVAWMSQIEIDNAALQAARDEVEADDLTNYGDFRREQKYQKGWCNA